MAPDYSYLRNFLNDPEVDDMTNYNEVRDDFLIAAPSNIVTLTQQPVSRFQLLIYVNGQQLTGGIGYTLDTTGTVVTFTNPLIIGDAVSAVYFVNAIT